MRQLEAKLQAGGNGEEAKAGNDFMRKATIYDTFKDDLYEAIDENGPYS